MHKNTKQQNKTIKKSNKSALASKGVTKQSTTKVNQKLKSPQKNTNSTKVFKQAHEQICTDFINPYELDKFHVGNWV